MEEDPEHRSGVYTLVPEHSSTGSDHAVEQKKQFIDRSKDQIRNFLNTIVAEKGASKNTVEAYKADLEQFFEFSSTCNKEDLSDFIRYLSTQGFAAKSINRKASALREFFKFLFSEKEIKENPAVHLSGPKAEKPLPKFLTETEIRKLAENANDIKIRCMIELMYACGLRVSELVSLPENCINFERKQLLVRGKGSKERIVPISDSAAKIALEYLTFRENSLKRKSVWFFPSSRSASGHLTRNAFFKRIKDIGAKAGIYAQRLSPHVLRHSFATHLLNHHADLRSVQKMLGHEDISTTEVYTHIITGQLIKTIQKNHPLAKKH